MEKTRGIKVSISRRGFDYSVDFESMASAARATGRSTSTIKERLKDGNWLRTDNGLNVKVRYTV